MEVTNFYDQNCYFLWASSPIHPVQHGAPVGCTQWLECLNVPYLCFVLSLLLPVHLHNVDIQNQLGSMHMFS